MFTVVDKNGIYYDCDGKIEYTVERRNNRFIAIPVIKVVVNKDYSVYYYVTGIINEDTVKVSETVKALGNDGAYICLTPIGKEQINVFYPDIISANKIADDANEELKKYNSWAFWRRDINDYKIPEKYHARIERLAMENDDKFDFRMMGVDGVEHCVYYFDDSGTACDIFTNRVVREQKSATWTCRRCGRALTQDKFKNGKMTYSTKKDGEKMAYHYCEDCVKGENSENSVKIHNPVKKNIPIKPHLSST